jgi:protein-S-isoprenylcysteine O-methyltransferase Ste14
MIRRGVRGLLFMGAMLFIPAGTLNYWQAWACLAVAITSPLLLLICFYKRDPQVIERRLNKTETVKEQKTLANWVRVVFVPVYALPGLDYRFGWTRSWVGPIPLWLTLLALVIFLGCQLLFIWVINVNRFAARTIQVESGQTVVTSGPYRWVRHPFYVASVLQMLAAPVALGSLVALPAFALVIPVIAIRLLNEEQVLRRDLPGYAEYCHRTPWRIVPFVW